MQNICDPDNTVSCVIVPHLLLIRISVKCRNELNGGMLRVCLVGRLAGSSLGIDPSCQATEINGMGLLHGRQRSVAV